MTGPTVKAPWILARCAQGAIAVAAVADVFRATSSRARALEDTAAHQDTSGTTWMVFTYVMLGAAVLFLVWFDQSRRQRPGHQRGRRARDRCLARRRLVRAVR